MKTILSKTELRKTILNKRIELTTTNSINYLSSKIVNKILNSDTFKHANNIGIYYPIKNEIDITSLINLKNKNFYFPRCKNNSLEFCLVKSLNELKIGAYNIPEPQNEPTNPNLLEVIYIPALAINKRCYRLGYGKGYYDRFFSKNQIKAKKILVINSQFIFDDFIEEKHDVKCDDYIDEI